MPWRPRKSQDVHRRRGRGEDRRARPRRLVPRGRLAAAQVQHRRLAEHADGRQRRRLRLRGGVPPRRPLGDLGQALGEAHERTPRGGITDKDFAVARQIEDTVLWRPADDSPLEGTPNKFVFSKGSTLQAAGVSERLLFVTGKLAAPALRDTLGRADLPFDYDVAVMKITVAALMTTDWIAQRLDVPGGGHPDHDPGDVRGRRRGPQRALRRSRPRRARPTSRRCRAGSGRPTRARATASATSACSPRSTTSRASTATQIFAIAELLPRRRRGRDRPRALARPRLARRGAGRDRRAARRRLRR